VGGEVKKVVPLALSIEALHAATLVHDDIIDKDEYRRDLPTVQSKWEVNNAILVGDALISLSIRLASGYGSRIVNIISNAGLALANGAHLEGSSSLTTMTEMQYMEMIRGKSASLFKAATLCGSLAGGGSREEVKALGNYGEQLGVAYQIRDDIEDLKTEYFSSIPADIRNAVPTLPLVHLYQRGDLESRTLLQRSFGQNATFNDSRRIIEKLKEQGSTLYSEQRIVESTEAACNALSILKTPEARRLLMDMFKVVAPSRYFLKEGIIDAIA
jgi:geranylgeranyl diphosphate synthase type I